MVEFLWRIIHIMVVLVHKFGGKTSCSRADPFCHIGVVLMLNFWRSFSHLGSCLITCWFNHLHLSILLFSSFEHEILPYLGVDIEEATQIVKSDWDMFLFLIMNSCWKLIRSWCVLFLVVISWGNLFVILFIFSYEFISININLVSINVC